MGAIKLANMAVMKDLETVEEFDAVRDFLLTDPLKITHSINFWKQELTNAVGEEKLKIERTIAGLKELMMNQATLTMNVYSISNINIKSDIDTTPEVKEETKPVEETKVEPQVKPEDVKLTVVKDNTEIIEADEQRILRVKYEGMIKKINVEALKQKCIDLIKAGKEADAVEVATFILANGLFTGKKVKQWGADKIAKFIDACKTDKVAEPVQTVQETIDKGMASAAESVDKGAETTVEIAPDEDLYKKYKGFIGGNSITLGGLEAEIKFQLNEGNVDMALELGTFLMSEGLLADTEKHFSNAEIEDFFKKIKQDLIDNPMNLNPEGTAPVDTTEVVTTPEEEKYDVSMSSFFADIKHRIITDGATEEEIRKYVFDSVKSQSIQGLQMYHKAENTQEELESMYVTFFISFIGEAYKEKNVMSLDTKEEIVKYIQQCLDKNEPTLGKAIQAAGKLYRARGENVNIKDLKETVYNIAAETHPEYYAKIMETLHKNVEEKVTIVKNADEKLSFDKKYPEIWEEVKDAKYLSDVYDIARDLEKKQSFLIVSEMITHLISSGKIKHSAKTPHPVKWDIGQIELWINTQFKTAPTVEEQKEVVDPISTPAETAPVAKEESTPVAQEENTVAGPVQTTEEAPSETAPNVNNTIAKILVGPNNYAIPEDRIKYKALYALEKNQKEFWDGFVSLIGQMITEGKTKQDITHEIADVIKEIAKNDDLSKCFARNYKSTRVDELYKVIEKKAVKLNVPGWAN